MARTEQKITFTEGEKFSLKDHLFNKEKVTRLACEVACVYPSFEKQYFIDAVMKNLLQLELKARIEHITDCLYTVLPQNYPDALEVILKALPSPLDPLKSDDDYGDYLYEPYNTYIARYGCNTQYYDLSLQALKETTQRFSAEFALRSFMKFDEERTLKKVHLWAQHKNYHIRRLASEGIRPNLPWGGKLNTEPEKIIQVLDYLYADPTRYVVRSVANNLNDISKTDLGLVVQTLRRWTKEGRQAQTELDYLIRHALRTALKNGNAQAMDFLGYKQNMPFTIQALTYKRKVSLGEKQHISFVCFAEEAGSYMIDYKIYFLKKDGSHTAKTFKIKDVFLEKGQVLHIAKSHPLRNMSTKKLYAGKHYFALQVNGLEQEKYVFDLEA